MTYDEVRGIVGTASVVFFFLFFIGMLAWVFRPGSKRVQDEIAKIPLRED